MKLRAYVSMVLLLASCAPSRSVVPKVDSRIRFLADSLLNIALETEALYTLQAPIKPVSSVGQALRFPIARDTSLPKGLRNAVPEHHLIPVSRRLRELNQALTFLSRENHTWHLVPFRAVRDSNRYLQIIVTNRARFDIMLQEHAPFFLQWGFVPGTDPAVLLTTIENTNRLDRYRAYGYLFGYPEHAITFFVEAARSEDSTGVFVQRDFFHVPVAKAKTGHFTWAVPKGYVPTEADSIIYRQAMETLKNFQLGRAGKRIKKR
jgi:hypothetical protein